MRGAVWVREVVAVTEAVVRPVYNDNPLHPQGSYTFYVARRVG